MEFCSKSYNNTYGHARINRENSRANNQFQKGIIVWHFIDNQLQCFKNIKSIVQYYNLASNSSVVNAIYHKYKYTTVIKNKLIIAINDNNIINSLKNEYNNLKYQPYHVLDKNKHLIITGYKATDYQKTF